MAIDKVREYFTQWDMESKILEFESSSATVELAAQALNCAPERIAKTLSFILDEKCILIVTAGDAKIDNSKFKTQFHKKAKMPSREQVNLLIGHDVGGVCPFGINENIDVYLDISLKRFTTVFPACGSSNSAIEITIVELEKYSNNVEWIDVCKEWQDIGGDVTGIEMIVDEIDWTSAWSKKYPILASYQGIEGINTYIEKISKLYDTFKNEFSFNDEDTVLVLKDILYQNFKISKK